MGPVSWKGCKGKNVRSRRASESATTVCALLRFNGVNLPVRSYRSDDHGAPLHVFYCYNAANEVLQRQLAQIIRPGLIRLPPNILATNNRFTLRVAGSSLNRRKNRVGAGSAR